MRDKKKQNRDTAGPKVNNSAVIRKIAKNTIKQNRAKSFVIILAAALCTFLFTVLFAVGGSLLTKQREETERQVGSSAMGSFKYLNEAEYRRIAADEKIKEVSRWIYVGEAANPQLLKLRTEIHWSDDVSAQKGFCYPKAGHMPQAEDELVTSTLVLKALGIEPQTGAKVTLEMDIGGQPVKKTFTLSGYFEGDHVAMAQIALVSKTFQETYAPTPAESFYADGTAAGAEDIAGRIDADVDFSIPFRIENQLYAAAVRAGLPDNVEVGVNWSSLTGTMDLSTMLLVIVLFAVIFLSGYLMINNVYRINVYADIRLFGLLKAIGMSTRQLKHLVRRQAACLSIPGILFGILAGVPAGNVLLPMIIRNYSYAESIDSSVDINLWILVFSALFSYITVRISCRRPAKTASKVSPIEAVRYTEGGNRLGKSKRSRRKHTAFHPFLFGYQNFARDKKKAAHVVLSLSLSLVVLNSVYTLIHGFDEDKYIGQFVQADFSAADATLDNPAVFENKNTSGVSQDFLDALKNQNGITDIGSIYLEYCLYQSFRADDYAKLEERLLKNPALKDMMQMPAGPDGGTMLDIYESQHGETADIYGMDQMAAESLPVLEGTFDWGKFQTGKYILVNEYNLMLPEGAEPIAYFHPGEKISVQNAGGETREYEVLAAVELPYALRLQMYSNLDICYVLPKDEFFDFFGSRDPMRTIFNAKDTAKDAVEEWIADYTAQMEPSLTYTSKKVYKEEFHDYTQMILIAGWLITGILALIGVLNLANTLVTSLLSRRLELAMLEAAGMTKKVQMQSICCEGMIYAFLSGIAGSIACALFSVFFVQPFGAEMWFFTWKFTLLPAALIFPVMLIVTVILPAVIYRYTMKASIVARLRLAEA